MLDRELPLHSLSRSAYREICAGVIGPHIMSTLVDAEYSRRLLLLRALMEAAAKQPASAGLADPAAAWDVLATVQRSAPHVVRDLILHPPFGVWLGHTVALSRDSGTVDAGGFGYLYLVAAAAAIRADVPCVLPVPVLRHEVVLPTVGRLPLSATSSADVAELRHTESRISVTDVDGNVAGGDDVRSVPVLTVSAADVDLVVRIDEADPYREFAEPLCPNETEPRELSFWRERLAETWGMMVRRHPGWADEIAAGLRLITPVDPAKVGGAFSSAAAIGAIAVPIGLSPTELAETFVHEVQHSKLNAVMNLVDLVAADAAGRYYAPWREDPRPLAGMLHGIYAFVAVAEFWLAHGATDVHAATYQFHLAYRRRQVRWALNSLAVADGLTELGAELLAAVDHRLAACERVAVAPELDAVVERMVTDHYACWRLRNIQPDPAAIAALADAWRHDRSADVPPPAEFAAPVPVWSDRVDLLRIRVLDRGRFVDLLPNIDTGVHSALRAGDIAYADDDYDGALARYQKTIGSLEAMVGIGLCLRAKDDHGAATALLSRPETIASVCAHLARLDLPADPVAVATWLAPVLGRTAVGAP